MASASQKNELASFENNISDTVIRRIGELKNEDGLKLPSNYNVGNALKSAWLKLKQVTDKAGKHVEEVCTMESVANALLDMVIQGLSPAKSQCYFIIRGDQLTLMRSYFGTAAVLKRLPGIQDVYAQVIYEDDVFEYEINGGNLVVTKHEQKLQNINMSKIIGAYSVIVKDGDKRCEIMTMDQIRTAWKRTSNGGKVQEEYPDQMAKRTVINRGAKMYVNTSDDADVLIDTINRTTASEYEEYYEVQQPVANGDVVSLPPAEEALPEPQQTEIPATVKKTEEAKTEKSSRRQPGF
jgi:recombination protein RecT